MRIEIKKYLMKEFGLTMDQAEDAASSSLRALRRRGMIKRIGYGMYCVNE
jgi:ribosomal protein L25 (general stress protein Ctc)